MTGGDADGDQRIDQDLRELFDLPDLVGAEFVAIDDGIVLVGEQRLLATPLAAEHDKGKALRQIGEAVLAHQSDQAQENLIVEMGNHAHHVSRLGAAAAEVQDQALNSRVDGFQFFEVPGLLDVEYQLMRRVRLQADDVAVGDDSRELALVVDHHQTMDPLARHPVQGFVEQVVLANH